MPSIARKKRPAKKSGVLKKTITTEIHGTDPAEEVIVDVLDFEVDPAYVSAKVGITKSLGASTYEFIRVDVSISVPCLPHPKVIDKTYSSLVNEAIDLLDETVDQLLED